MTAPEVTGARWPHATTDIGPALAVAVLGVVEVAHSQPGSAAGMTAGALVVVATAAAVGMWRRMPPAALAIAWGTGVAQVVGDLPALLVQVSLALVAFGCARWGTRTVVVLGGLSAPLGTAAGFLALYSQVYQPRYNDSLRRALAPLLQVVDTPRYGGVGVGAVVLTVVGALVLGLPWLAGLSARYLSRARTSQAEAEAAYQREAEATEVAAVRAEQARLAADVHDVVGHSLAVILAQAEAGQYLPDEDPARLKQTLSVIADSARTSLTDVRDVLRATRTPGFAATAGHDDLGELVTSARRSGRDVTEYDTGTRRPLAPDVAAVAYRTLQEMVTNAIRHGSADTALHIERTWGDGLQLRVHNQRPPADTDRGGATDGHGLQHMRGRLTSIGGRLDVDSTPTTWTTTAWLPAQR